MTNMMNMILMLFFISCMLFTILYKHLLMTLMSLEIIMMTLLLYMYMYMLLIKFEYFILFFLVMIVCEGILGLTLLILFIRFKGSDKLKLMNLMLW
uniref:NADH-ubiquinone oxidoreductase chain 4L n=1 Tax=Prosaspicera validispina TaxID=2943453 RepID=A0A9E8G799_9HYME|nr:NADH dehydrogenase subunit 4L [Prosaspicera validispina]